VSGCVSVHLFVRVCVREREKARERQRENGCARACFCISAYWCVYFREKEGKI